MTTAVNLHDAIHAVDAADDSQRFAKARQEVLAKTKSPPVMDDEIALESLCRSIEESIRQRERAAAVISTLQKHVAPPELVDPEPLKAVLDSMESMARSQLAATQRVAAVEKLIAPTEPSETAPLQELIGKLDQTVSAVNAQKRDVAALNDELSKVKNEMRAWAEANPLCPTCGAPVDPERIASVEHAHE
jgi:DNA repair exonuclease SbcCD ATPase subunit